MKHRFFASLRSIGIIAFDHPTNPRTPDKVDTPSPPLRANVGYLKLEPRQVLSASFVYGTGALLLEGFDAGQDLSFAQQSVAINGSVQDAFVFDVASGSWSGSTADPWVELQSVSGGLNNRLEVATAFFGGAANAKLTLDGATTIGSEVGVSQTTSLVTFGSLDISNFTNFDRSLQLNTAGDVLASNLTVADSNPNDGFDPAVDLQIKTRGDVLVDGPLHNLVANQNADIVLVAERSGTDVVVSSNVETALGNVSIAADDSVIFASTGSLGSGFTGNIDVAAGLDGLTGNDADQIRMTSGSMIDAGAGKVTLDTVLGGDVVLGQVTSLKSDDAITINAGGTIVDGLNTEGANLAAANGRVSLLTDSSIGSTGTGDINIQSQFLQFDSVGETHLTDIASGLTIDRISATWGGGEIRSTSSLTISADVNLGGSTVFASGDSALIDDDLTINNNAHVHLTANTSSTLEFFSGDDIVIDTGRIETAGVGSHTIRMTADHEGVADADRGSLTNTAGNSPVVLTNQLELVSFDGIGDASSGPNVNEPLRINVDRLIGSNQGENDLLIEEFGSIDLVDIETNDGAIFVAGFGQVNVTNVTSGETETSEDGTDDVTIVSTAGSITVSQIYSADNLVLETGNGNIRDSLNSNITVESNARFVAESRIEFTDSQNDLLRIQGNANFEAVNVSIGQDLQPAGSVVALNTFLGNVTFNSNSAILVEDDATVLSGASQVAELSLASLGDITNLVDTTLGVSGHTQLNATNGIFLGTEFEDSFVFNALGVVADNVHVELDSSVELDGRAPNQAAEDFGSPGSQGTEVEQTLFVTSTGSIVQPTGQLDAANIGLKAAGHVHLAQIAARNENVAINAGIAAPLTDATTIQILNVLASVVNSEVNANLPQSIAVIHEGTLNVSMVNSPLISQSLSGLTTTDGSIFSVAKNEISLQQDIVAQSPNNDPQVTVYVESGIATDSGIHFDGGQVEVAGPTNSGIVNKVQTTATFFDDDGFVLPGTTEILVLNTDGTADQDIVVEYADPGESGYRAIIVWDKDNQPGQPVEIINTFVSDPDVDSEEHEDAILQDNDSIVRTIGDFEGERKTFSKFPQYSKEAIIAHQDNPNVFSTVTVRNDQDINLFTGTLETVNNSLNETSQTLRAELDSPKRSSPVLPTISPINPIEVKAAPELPVSSATPELTNTLTFSRDIQPFETGDLKWVLVKVPLSEMEESDGEVRLKDPTKIFSRADGADVNNLDDEIGENEVEKIIHQIETDEKAESGYWYKVFKDYRNRDNELFFYHFKTGEFQPTDSAPQSDFEALPEPQSDLEGSNDREDDLERENLENSLDRNPDLSVPSKNENGNLSELPGSSRQFLSAGSLMMAGLMIRRSSVETQPQLSVTREGLPPRTSANDPPNNDLAPRDKFGRFDRLQRKIKNVLGQQDQETSTNE